MSRSASVLVIGLGLWISAAAQVPEPSGESSTKRFERLLRTYLALNDGEISSVYRRHIITRQLEPDGEREVATAGAVRIDVPLEYYAERMRDIVGYKKSASVLTIKGWRGPPDAEVFSGLVLEPDDVEDLRKCQVGACGVQLDAIGLERFGGQDWTAASATDRANVTWRRLIRDYVDGYLRSGESALLDYADSDPPVDSTAEARAVRGRMPVLQQELSDLDTYLRTFPAPSPFADDSFYWSKEKFGFRPTISVTHLTIWRQPGAIADVAVTSRQIYASHYFDTSLGLTMLFGHTPDSGPRTYLVYINRTLVDALEGGWFGGIKRSLARGKTRSGLEDNLEELRTRIEADYARDPASATR